jgi:hypothetical protein
MMSEEAGNLPKTAQMPTISATQEGLKVMRLKLETSEVKFRVAGTAKPKKDPKNRESQARTPEGAPVWVVRTTRMCSAAPG